MSAVKNLLLHLERRVRAVHAKGKVSVQIQETLIGIRRGKSVGDDMIAGQQHDLGAREMADFLRLRAADFASERKCARDIAIRIMHREGNDIVQSVVQMHDVRPIYVPQRLLHDGSDG
jgi:hypothetical protein